MKRYMLAMLCVALTPLMCASPNTLEQVFYHAGARSSSTKPAHHIELGSLVFYFKQDPVMNALPQRNASGKNVNLVFFFPKSQVNSSLIEKVNQVNDPRFQIKMEVVKTPIDGIKLQVTYDPASVAFKYEHFESIKQQKGMVFRFFNKELINMIREKGKVVSVMANNTRAPRVVIDCGHGGSDAGATGKKTTEKEVCLAVGHQLATYLEDRGCEVILTRATDETVTLDERTSHANSHPGALVFVSLHANASRDRAAKGIETFYIDPALFVSGDANLSCPLSEVGHRMTCQRYAQGRFLAQCVHESLVAHAQEAQENVVDRNVKKAVSQVLLGSCMPATLVEMGFISNSDEEMLLASSDYQAVLARGIGSGIMRYLQTVRLF